MPRNPNNKTTTIELTPGQHRALSIWKHRHGHKSLAAAIRTILGHRLQQDGIDWPDDLPAWGDPARLRPDDD